MQKSKLAKLLCIAMSLMMLLSAIPFSASAAQTEEQSETITYANTSPHVGVNFTITPVSKNSSRMFGGDTNTITITANDPDKIIITKVEATVISTGSNYAGVGFDRGIKVENGAVPDNSIVHITNINAPSFVIGGGTSYVGITDVTVYYRIKDTDNVVLPENAEWIVPNNIWYSIDADTMTIGGCGKIPALDLLEFPDTVTNVMIEEDIDAVAPYAFYGKNKIQSVTLPATVYSVGKYAFSGCTALETIVVGSNGTAFDSKAFNGLDGSKITAYIPCYFLNTAGSGTSASAAGVKTEILHMTEDGSTDVWPDVKIKNYVICEICGCEHTGHTFVDGVCSVCGSVELPEGAQWANNPLESGFGATGRVWYKVDGDTLTVGGKGAVPGFLSNFVPGAKTTIKHIVVEEGIIAFQTLAFANFSVAETISLPDTLEEMGSQSIYNCPSLKRIEIPSSVKTITDCFRNCSALEEIILHEGLETISGLDIYKDTALSSLVIPASVKSFSGYLSKSGSDSSSFDLIFLGSNTAIPDSYTMSGGYSIRLVKSPCGAPAREACNGSYYSIPWESNGHTYVNGVCCCGAVCSHDSAENTVEFTWNNAGTSVVSVAKYCGECGTKISDIAINAVTVTEVILEEATHYTTGKKTYSASVTVGSETYTDNSSKTFTISIIPHNYVDFVCECGAEDIAGAKADAIAKIEAAEGDAYGTDGIVNMAEANIKKAANVAAVTAEKEKALAAIAALNTDYAAVLEAMQDDLDEAEAALADAQDEITAKTATINETQAKLDAAENKLTEADAQITALTSELDTTKATLADTKAELETTKTGKAALETQLAAKIDELAALNTTLGEKEDIITALEADIDDLEAAIDEKDAVITALNDTVASLEKTVADAEAEIAAKQAKIDELTALLETANAELNDIHSNCPYCGKVHQNVFDKFFCMIIRFFQFLASVFEFSAAT